MLPRLAAAAERMVGDQEDRAVMKAAATIEAPRILLVEATPVVGVASMYQQFNSPASWRFLALIR